MTYLLSFFLVILLFGEWIIRIGMRGRLSLIVSLLLLNSGCAWVQSHKSQLGATGSWLARKAAILAVETIVNAAQSPQDLRDKSDWIDSMAAGFRTVDKSSLLTADDVKQLAAVWVPQAKHWEVLGTQLAASYALSGGPSQQRLEALAVGLQDAAQEGRAEAAALTGP